MLLTYLLADTIIMGEQCFNDNWVLTCSNIEKVADSRTMLGDQIQVG